MMKPNQTARFHQGIRLTSLAATLFVGSIASASVVFTDTFDSGTGDWYKAYSNVGTTLQNDSGALSWSVGSTGDGYQVIGRSFTEQTLAVGETISLSFDFTPTSNTGIMRFGFHNLTDLSASADDWSNTNTGSYAGYGTFIRDTGSNVARVENGPSSTNTANAYALYMGTNGGASATAIGSNLTDYSLVNNSTYQISFDVTRTSATQTDTLLTVLDGATERYSVAGSQTSGTTYNVFDTATLRISEGTALYDNVTVSVIPEPSVAILGGLGSLLLLRRRR